MTLTLDGDCRLAADPAVLAIGNFPPEPPPGAEAGFLDSCLHRLDPWSPGALAGIGADAAARLIGTGLTMVDAVISLLDQGHCGPIHALSRRGLLPRQRAPPSPRAGSMPNLPSVATALPGSLPERARSLRMEARQTTANGEDLRPVVDRFRPFFQDI